MRPLFLGAAMAVVALPALAEPSSDEVQAFVEAVVSLGCVVETDAQAAAVEEATGFTDAKLAEIVGVLLADGRAVVPASAEGLRLLTGGCA
ncbi:MAG: hypothetical protein ACXIU8_16585 [Alkalilacustris sp.]